jgi:hypothetical protein
LITPIAALPLVAACSSSHPEPKPIRISVAPAPDVNVAVLRAYAVTIDRLAPHVDAANKALRGCQTASARCRADAAAAAAVTATLDRRLHTVDSLREGDLNATPLAPGISPILVTTESDARKVKRSFRRVSAAAGGSAITELSKQMDGVAVDVDAWEPGGRAATAIAAVHVTIPIVPSPG